jgi:hypothetical protein
VSVAATVRDTRPRLTREETIHDADLTTTPTKTQENKRKMSEDTAFCDTHPRVGQASAFHQAGQCRFRQLAYPLLCLLNVEVGFPCLVIHLPLTIFFLTTRIYAYTNAQSCMSVRYGYSHAHTHSLCAHFPISSLSLSLVKVMQHPYRNMSSSRNARSSASFCCCLI